MFFVFYFLGIFGGQDRAAGIRVGGRKENHAERENGQFQVAETTVSGEYYFNHSTKPVLW